MRKGSYSTEIGASPEEVFDVVHDYERRLEWDSMLSEAKLLAGETVAKVGVRSLCTGTWKTAFLALETEYVRFEPGEVAAVKLTNRPLFFEHFAATIRHDAVGESRSRTTYIYSFRARPRFLAPLLEPIMDLMLAREVRHRLRGLRHFLESGRQSRSPRSR
jgi:hypothetical protein